MTGNRGINTVIDVALALLFLSVAVALISTLPMSEESDHEPFDADRTADVFGTATLDVTYSIEPVLEDAADTLDDTEYDDGDEQARRTRISHGSMASQVGDAAIARLVVGSEQVTRTGEYYEGAIDQLIQTQLVGAQFETNVTAHWEPFTDASISGTATVGAERPPNQDTSTAELTVSSSFDTAREEAITAVETGGGYGEIAEILADTIIEGYVPALDSKRALERGGTERTLTRYRYERLATLLENASPEKISEQLEIGQVDTVTANEYLAGQLAEELTVELEERFETPRAAARAVSTGKITLSVRTWEP